MPKVLKIIFLVSCALIKHHYKSYHIIYANNIFIVTLNIVSYLQDVFQIYRFKKNFKEKNKSKFVRLSYKADC